MLALALLVFVTALLTNLGTLALGLSVLAHARIRRAARRRAASWCRGSGDGRASQRALSSGLQASTPRRVTAMAALSLLGWASELVMLVLFQGAFHLAPSVRTALLTLVGINAAIAIPALPGNFGTFEAGVTMALVMCGAPRDVAVSYALTYHLSHVIPVALVATGVYLSAAGGTGRRPRDLDRPVVPVDVGAQPRVARERVLAVAVPAGGRRVHEQSRAALLEIGEQHLPGRRQLIGVGVPLSGLGGRARALAGHVVAEREPRPHRPARQDVQLRRVSPDEDALVAAW